MIIQCIVITVINIIFKVLYNASYDNIGMLVSLNCGG